MPAVTGLKADRESGEVSHEPGMARLTLGVGRDHGVQPGDVLGVIVGITKLPKETVGVIRLQTKQTFVDVAEEHADLVVSKLNGIQFKGRKLWCKRATVGKPIDREDIYNRSRPWGSVKSSAGPIGTMRVGLMSSCV